MKKIADLQRRQQEHDQKYHADIAKLPRTQRISHLVLHCAKYVGRLMERDFQPWSEETTRTLVDAVIIALSIANAIPVKLAELPDLPWTQPSGAWTKDPDLSGSHAWQFHYDLAVATGHMAKACESHDHGVMKGYAETLAENVHRIIRSARVNADLAGVDLFEQIEKKWAVIERL